MNKKNKVEKIIQGNNIEVLKTFPDNYFDSVITDPPYGISFMGKKWDYEIPSVETWKEVIRVLKPGGYMLVACGTRTQHRMAVNIEDAGFEIRDIVAWVYGSGFPKGQNISKGIEAELKLGGSSPKHLRKNRMKEKYEPTGQVDYKKGRMFSGDIENDIRKEVLETDLAKKYEGWNTNLKPAMELWTMARKPLSEDTVAKNVIKYGVGGINIDDSRTFVDKGDLTPRDNKEGQNGSFNASGGYVEPNEGGRYPANFIHDGSEEVVKHFPETAPSKAIKGGANRRSYKENITNPSGWKEINRVRKDEGYDDAGGSASRFFYVPKASQSERNYGLTKNKNIHPTVKPIDLMRYLIKMITPQDGIVLDLYVGSGTTLIGAKLEKFQFVGIELEKEYVEIEKARVKAHMVHYDIFDYME